MIFVERAEAAGLGPFALSSQYADASRALAGLVIGYAGHSPDQLTSSVERLAAIVLAADSSTRPGSAGVTVG
ncbi:MAG: hypothetical protein JXA67_08465 [Micromonosporaceae bacterium]|nr:hypothetical protein [Micromonosporaceae bacterium]